MSDGERPADRPLLRIVNPDATAEEVAALVAALATLSGGADGRPAVRRSEWASPHRTVRVRYSHGPGGWMSSGLPR